MRSTWVIGCIILSIVLLVVTFPEPGLAQGQCVVRAGMKKKGCQKQINRGCPMKYGNRGCKHPKTKKQMGDGGCQPLHSCSYCCKERCKGNRGAGAFCKWDKESQKCFSCWSLGAAHNGPPAFPNAPVIFPPNYDWGLYGLGDSFQMYERCNSNGQYITGMTLWLAEMDEAKRAGPVDSTIYSNIIFFYRDGSYRVGHWSGECSMAAIASKGKPKGVRKVTCDFTTSGTIIHPNPCQLPALPSGVYDVLYQHTGSTTLGWVQSMEDTGCNILNCAFTQQMAPDVLPRYEVCEENPKLQNFAFQIHGTSVKPTIVGCT